MRTADRWHDAGMRPRTVRLLTGLATLAVLASAAYVAALGDWATASVCAACTFAVAVGWVIVRHDPTSPVGSALAWTTAPIALVTAHVGPLAELPWSSGAWPLNLAGLLVLMLVFPDGASNGTLWRTVPWVFGSATLGMLAVQWGARQVDGEVVGGPDAVWVPWVAVASLIAIGFSMVLAAASLVVRYWRGTRRTRQQTRWLLLAGIVVVALLAGGWVAEVLGASLNAAYTPFLVAIVVLVPIAVGLAIVRYDLFDVDRLLTGATAWLVTVVVSAAVFGAAVYGLSQAVSAGTGLTSSVAAFITALTLLPVQRHVAQCVGRVVDRDRHVAVAEVERFAADVRAGRRQPEEVEAVLRKVQDDPDLVVYLARPDGNWTRLDGAPVAEPPDGIGIEAGGDDPSALLTQPQDDAVAGLSDAGFAAQVIALLVDARDQQLELPRLARRFLVHVNDLADLGDGETEPLAAQDLLDEMAVGGAEQARAPAAHRRDQPLVLVEPQRTRRDAEFAGQFGDGVVVAHRAIRFCLEFCRANYFRHLRKSQLKARSPCCGMVISAGRTTRPRCRERRKSQRRR